GFCEEFLRMVFFNRNIADGYSTAGRPPVRPRRVASRIFLMSDKIVSGSSELGPRRNGHGRNVMSRWKIKAATAALAALLVAATVSLPVYGRELQPLAVAAPEQVGMSAGRLARITTMLQKEMAEGKLPGALV